MLSNSQKKQLKSLTSSLNYKYLIGKSEITDSVISMLDKALECHELIKIKVLKSASDDFNAICLDVSSKLNADIVQKIGNVFVLYRKSKNNPKILLTSK